MTAGKSQRSFHSSGSLTVTHIREVLVVAVLHVLLEAASEKKNTQNKKTCESEEPIPRLWRSCSGSGRFN